MFRQKKAQAWSIDLVIGVLIFLLVVGLFYATLTRNQSQDTTSIRIASETVATKLVNDPETSIVENNKVSSKKLKELIKQIKEEPDLVRQEFGIEGDFCIFFEDERGNLFPIFIDEDDGVDVYHGIGSDRINVTGISCGDIAQS